MSNLQTIVNDIIIEQDYKEFALYINTTNYLTENIIPLNALSENIKDKIRFAKNIASLAKKNLKDVLIILQNSKVFKFLSLIGWNISKLFDLLKNGLKYYRMIFNAISEYISKTKVGKWTEKNLKKLDIYLSNHPKLKRITGIAVASILIFIWFKMTFTGDAEYDFDMTDVIDALGGNFTLHTLFAGPTGIKLLMLFVTGLVGLSFPWPGPTSVKFVGTMLIALGRFAKKKLRKEKI